MSYSEEDYQDFSKFVADVTGLTRYDGYLEVVTDLHTSRYFDDVSKAYDYAKTMSADGHEVHYGPTLRKKDLGSVRSDRSNLGMIRSFYVDIDAPDKSLPDDVKQQQAKQLLDEFIDMLKGYGVEPTHIVASGNGFHVYLVLSNPVTPDETWSRIEKAIVTLAKGDSQAKDPVRLLRLPGTFNYKDRGNPKPVKIIFSSNRSYSPTDFDKLVQECATAQEPKVVCREELKPLGFVPPCIGHILKPDTQVPLGKRHLTRNVVATFGHREGWPVEGAIEKVKHFTDDPKKSEDDVRGIYKVLDHDPSKYSVGCDEGSNLKALVDAGVTVCDKDKCQFGKPPEVKEDEKETYSAHFDGLVDLVLDDQGKVAYLVLENGRLVVKLKHKTLQGVFVPPPLEQVRWELARAPEVLRYYGQDSDSRLFEDLVAYHRSISELPSDGHYKFLAVYDMHTYLSEKGEYSPMVWFFAIPERGKTRTGKGIIYVAYRGIHLITLNEAHILRMARDHRATIFFDITDLQEAARAANVRDVLLNRYERGATVCRVHYPDRGPFRDTVYYPVFGPTIVATNEMVDDILATRSVQVIMPQSARIFDDDVKPIMGLPFRERLLAFRARWMQRDLPVAAKPCAGRLGDILRPIRQIVRIVGTDESWLLDFVRGAEQQRKLIGSDSLEAQVVNAIKVSVNKISNGHILHEHILENLNRNRSEREKVTAHKLGKVTSSLSFEKYNSGQQRGIYWDDKLMISLCQRYGIEFDIQII